jgi:SAM-dependent methyltransferase
MTPESSYILNRSGMAALSDLGHSAYKSILGHLEKEQDIFLSKEYLFRSANYRWPRDPLHDFSRIWEYPYVYYHLDTYLKSLSNKSNPTVADIGSGVTFFPFSLAKLGYQVVCADIDPICESDLARAIDCIPHSPGKVDFRIIERDRLPFNDSECDAVYCISVIEHIPDFVIIIEEIYRILKPGGQCLITCDINLEPHNDLQLDITNYNKLMTLIERLFVRVYPDRTIHPLDLLTMRNSLYPRKESSPGTAKIASNILKQKYLKPILGRKPGNLKPPLLGVLGLALKKV